MRGAYVMAGVMTPENLGGQPAIHLLPPLPKNGSFNSNTEMWNESSSVLWWISGYERVSITAGVMFFDRSRKLEKSST